MVYCVEHNRLCTLEILHKMLDNEFVILEQCGIVHDTIVVIETNYEHNTEHVQLLYVRALFEKKHSVHHSSDSVRTANNGLTTLICIYEEYSKCNVNQNTLIEF